MTTLPYTIIRTEAQYAAYCHTLQTLATTEPRSEQTQEEIDLLTLLIEKWDADHTTLPEADPIALLKSLLAGRNLKAKDLTAILGLSKGAVSDILNYRRGLSKEVIRVLADYFKVSQEAFNREYKLRSAYNTHLRNAVVMNTAKELATS